MEPTARSVVPATTYPNDDECGDFFRGGTHEPSSRGSGSTTSARAGAEGSAAATPGTRTLTRRLTAEERKRGTPR
jgi:hypothetical protein